MKRIAALLFLFAIPALAHADATTRRMIVVTRHPFAQAERALRGARGDDFDFDNRVRYNVKAFTIINGFAADLTAEEIAQLKKSPEVSYIEPVIERYKFGASSPRHTDDSTRALELAPAALADSITAGQQTVPYGVTLVGAPNVWPVTRGKSLDPKIPTRVVVVDTGVDYNNPELKAIYKGGLNVVGGNNNPIDDDGHGTHVAGTIAAADDGMGVVGVASQVELYAIKVLDECGIGSNASSIDALDWITKQKKAIGGNWIANFSLGSNTSSPSERSAFQKAADAGVLIFAAAGNSFPDKTALAF
ncbi:MAG: S8 family serine peptidase, partial [Thermoanaerobaculia bacterium]